MIKNIIFDFDGVILDSIPVKTEAFRKLLTNFPKDKVDKLVEFHLKNAGMSRYKKIEYFFTHIINESITNKDVLKYAEIYSQITKEELAQKKYLIKDSLDFIRENYKNYNMHIASGADEKDLRYICHKLRLEEYFLSINGSPKVKGEIVKDILYQYKYKFDETILIGDSINDAEAATVNGIDFYGYNNENLREYKYIEAFKCIENI
jgi:phosphoglycolate phosphatase-like HAD superfamily hydrolase